MAIFGKKHDESEEIQLFESTENEKTFFFANQKTLVRIDDHFIRIARQNTISNALLQGLDGEKSILLSKITAYQLKEPGKTVGYLQLIFPGSIEPKGGVFDAVKDENTITFNKEDKVKILEIKNAIEKALINN
jgi:hypothetical protein